MWRSIRSKHATGVILASGYAGLAAWEGLPGLPISRRWTCHPSRPVAPSATRKPGPLSVHCKPWVWAQPGKLWHSKLAGCVAHQSAHHSQASLPWDKRYRPGRSSRYRQNRTALPLLSWTCWRTMSLCRHRSLSGRRAAVRVPGVVDEAHARILASELRHHIRYCWICASS